MPRAIVQCELCGHVWSWSCASIQGARDRLSRTTVCPGLRCHPFTPDALPHVNLEIQTEEDTTHAQALYPRPERD